MKALLWFNLAAFTALLSLYLLDGEYKKAMLGCAMLGIGYFAGRRAPR